MTPSPNIRPHLLRSAVFLTPFVISIVFWMLGTGSSIMSGVRVVGGGGGRAFDLGPSFDAALMVIGLGGMAVSGIAWTLSLFVPVRESVAEGGLLVDDGAGSSGAVHELLRRRFERQGSPFTVRPDTLEGQPTLEVHADVARATILVRTLGPDLRIGWTMWTSRSTVNLILETFPGRRGHEGAVLDADLRMTMLRLLEDAVGRAAATATIEERR